MHPAEIENLRGGLLQSTALLIGCFCRGWRGVRRKRGSQSLQRALLLPGGLLECGKIALEQGLHAGLHAGLKITQQCQCSLSEFAVSSGDCTSSSYGLLMVSLHGSKQIIQCVGHFVYIVG